MEKNIEFVTSVAVAIDLCRKSLTALFEVSRAILPYHRTPLSPIELGQTTPKT